MGFGEAAAMLGGPALGGMLLAVSGARGAVTVDAISYLGSAALIAAIVAPPAAGACTSHEVATAGMRGPRAAARSVWIELHEGITAVLARPTLRMLFAAGALLFLGSGITNVLFVVMVGEVWGGGAAQFGWLIAAIGAGAVVGGPLMGVASGRLGARALIALGGLGLGAVLLVIVNQPSMEVAIAVAALVGVFQVWSNVGMTTLLQTGSDDRNRGRVASLFAAVTGAAALPSAALAGAVAALIGVRLVLDAAGLLCAASGLVALLGRPSPATINTARAAPETTEYAEAERG